MALRMDTLISKVFFNLASNYLHVYNIHTAPGFYIDGRALMLAFVSVYFAPLPLEFSQLIKVCCSV